MPIVAVIVLKAFATVKSYSTWVDINTKGVKQTEKEVASVIGPGIGDSECQQGQQRVNKAASDVRHAGKHHLAIINTYKRWRLYDVNTC